MTKQVEFSLPAYSYGFHLVTDDIVKHLDELPETGLLHLFIQHTSAGLTLNENADATVLSDFNRFFKDWIPENYRHFQHTYEGPDDMPAHIKSSVIGHSVTIPIRNGRLALGIWQGIYLGEFRYHGGRRRIVATVVG